MTRKHFELIAEILRSQEPPTYSDDYYIWSDIVDEFCDKLKGENPNFDSERFRKACTNG